jgi:aflatoxin B1 aldehyde reductase
MGVDKVDVLYLHFPDSTTPIIETLEACAQLHQKGLFTELGLSNYSAWEVVNIWHICDKNGWVRPTVYQGVYNGLSRNVEDELIPALRNLGMRFYAYNPLAGGILAGKYSDIDNITDGRFTERPNYKGRYWKPEFFDALSVLKKACDESGISVLEAAFRWLSAHSKLDGEQGDSILIGASSITQLKQNLSLLTKGKLDESVVNAFNYAWSISKPESPTYFRSVG